MIKNKIKNKNLTKKMKKILTTLAVSGFALGSFAQGYVNWNAGPAGDLISATNAATYSSISPLGTGTATGQAGGVQGNTAGLSGNVYYYELLYSTTASTAPTTVAGFSSWTATGLLMEDSLTANNGRQNVLGASSSAMIDPTYVFGNTVYLMIVGWSANLGTTFAGTGGVQSVLSNWANDGIANAYFGESYVGTDTTLSSSSGSGSLVWAASQTVGGLISNPSSSPMVMNELNTVPEPTSLALVAMGAGSLLALRRRK
jgi:hypothetical protein